MDELIRMIDRTDRVVNFYVKCPEGKRGRPMNAGRAAAMSKIDSSSVCVKESKEGGRTTFHGMGNKSVHKQVSQEIKTKAEELGDLRRSDLLNLAGRLGVKTKDAYSHEDLMHLIVDETLRAKARSRAI